MFVANLAPPGIYVAQADTFNFTLIPGSENTGRPVAVDYDPVDSRLYWTDVNRSSIQRSFLDGSGVEVLITNLDSKHYMKSMLMFFIMTNIFEFEFEFKCNFALKVALRTNKNGKNVCKSIHTFLRIKRYV